MKLVPVNYYGFTAMDRRFSSPMLPWIVTEIRKRDYNEKLSLGIEDGIIQAYNQDFELQFSHKICQITRFSQADQDPTTFLYLIRDDNDTLLYCYLFQAQKASDILVEIDEVLEPLVKGDVSNASAYDFLVSYYKWNIRGLNVGVFADRVTKSYRKITKLYSDRGRNTYFVPIDNSLDVGTVREMDQYIIAGHVVLDHVLFTRPSDKNFVFATASSTDFCNNSVTLTHINDKYYVKSYTVLGVGENRKGWVEAEIIFGNIPVNNGVVHLISRPLGIFEKQLTLFPLLPILYKLQSDPDLSITYQLSKRIGLDRILAKSTEKFTFFIPNDRAWERLFTIFGSNPFVSRSELIDGKIRDIVGRHLFVSVTKSLRMEDFLRFPLRYNDGETIVQTVSGPLSLSFVKIWDDDYSMTWKGKKINVVRADYQCQNGIVHILDGVFVDLLEFQDVVDGAKSEGGTNGFWASLKHLLT